MFRNFIPQLLAYVDCHGGVCNIPLGGGVKFFSHSKSMSFVESFRKNHTFWKVSVGHSRISKSYKFLTNQKNFQERTLFSKLWIWIFAKTVSWYPKTQQKQQKQHLTLNMPFWASLFIILTPDGKARFRKKFDYCKFFKVLLYIL